MTTLNAHMSIPTPPTDQCNPEVTNSTRSSPMATAPIQYAPAVTFPNRYINAEDNIKMTDADIIEKHPSPHLHPTISATTKHMEETKILGTVYHGHKFHKLGTRQITSQDNSVTQQRNEMTFDIAQLFESTFNEMQAHVFSSTTVRGSFVVRNSAEGSAIRPATAAFIESLDFVKFFDQIKHGKHAQLPLFRTSTASHYAYSLLNRASCYYQPDHYASKYIDSYGWRETDLTAAISGFDIEATYQEWLQPAGPDRNEAAEKRRHAAEPSDGHQQWRYARTFRVLQQLRSGDAIVPGTPIIVRQASANASRMATIAATAATDYSAFTRQMVLRFISMAAIYSAALVARHAATASNIFAASAANTSKLGAGLIQHIHSILNKCVHFYVGKLKLTGNWDEDKQPAIFIKTHPTREGIRTTCKFGISNNTKFAVHFTKPNKDCSKSITACISIAHVKRLITQAILSNPISVGEAVWSTIKGIPQGGKWSSLIASLFLADPEDDYMATFYRPIMALNAQAIRLENTMRLQAPLFAAALEIPAGDAESLCDTTSVIDLAASDMAPTAQNPTDNHTAYTMNSIDAYPNTPAPNIGFTLCQLRVALQLIKLLRITRAEAYELATRAAVFAFICRYADDIWNTPPRTTIPGSLDSCLLRDICKVIYGGLVPLEDTAHYRGLHDGKPNLNVPTHITSLDLTIRWNNATKRLTHHLFSKRDLFPVKPVGIMPYDSCTDPEQFASVFASESLRYYNSCSEFDDFIKATSAYLLHFMQRGYPRHLLLSKFVTFWSPHVKRCRESTKYA